MSTEIRVPQLPESVADATLVAWRKKPGEAVSRDENLTLTSCSQNWQTLKLTRWSLRCQRPLTV